MVMMKVVEVSGGEPGLRVHRVDWRPAGLS